MAVLYSDLKEGLNATIPRLKDLLPVARGYTYLKGYNGSFSIKNVAPALAPSVNYKKLDLISDGNAASSSFALISAGRISNKDDCKKLRKALLAYCKLDTLAMVKAHRAMIKLSI